VVFRRKSGYESRYFKTVVQRCVHDGVYLMLEQNKVAHYHWSAVSIWRERRLGGETERGMHGTLMSVRGNVTR
jgi:hypothetical protein